MDEQIIFIIGISVGIVSIGLVIFIVLLIHFTRKLQGLQKPQRPPPAVPPADYFQHATIWTTSSQNVTEYIPEDIADNQSALEELLKRTKYRQEYDNNWDAQSDNYDNNFANGLGPEESDNSASCLGESSSNESPNGHSSAKFTPRTKEILVCNNTLKYGTPVIDPRPGAPDTPMTKVVGDVIVHIPGYNPRKPSEQFSEDTEGYMRPKPTERET